MGMYTELYLACDLQKNTPEEVLNYFKQQLNDQEITSVPEALLDTRFKNGVLVGSYYFYGIPTLKLEWDEIGNNYHLLILTNLKNYSDEIRILVDLLMPYIDAAKDEHIGHIRYEEDDLPTFLIKLRDET